MDTENDGEVGVGPAATPVPGADEEEAAPGAGEDPRARTFLVGTLVEISSNSCRVREPTSAPSAGETSDTLRFFVPLGAVNNRTSPARMSSSNPKFQQTTLAFLAASIKLKRPIKRERAFLSPRTFQPCLIRLQIYKMDRPPSENHFPHLQ